MLTIEELDTERVRRKLMSMPPKSVGLELALTIVRSASRGEIWFSIISRHGLESDLSQWLT